MSRKLIRYGKYIFVITSFFPDEVEVYLLRSTLFNNELIETHCFPNMNQAKVWIKERKLKLVADKV